MNVMVSHVSALSLLTNHYKIINSAAQYSRKVLFFTYLFRKIIIYREEGGPFVQKYISRT